MLKELVVKNRSYRRYYEDKKISMDELKELIDLARICPSGSNKQPIRYKLVNDEETNKKIFENLGWAAALKDWDGPLEGERPAAYVVLASDKNANAGIDEGIAGQTLLLAAAEKGFGGIFLGNVNRKNVAEIIGLPENLKIDYVIALGYPKEEIVLEEAEAGSGTSYYRDENMVHHVPKRRLEDILL